MHPAANHCTGTHSYRVLIRPIIWIDLANVCTKTLPPSFIFREHRLSNTPRRFRGHYGSPPVATVLTAATIVTINCFSAESAQFKSKSITSGLSMLTVDETGTPYKSSPKALP